MRIISGKNKGRRISAPKKLVVRPTTNRAKEALFNIITNRYKLDETSVLDLFSGFGNISYEFASRGTSNIIAVDNNLSCIKFIKKISEELEMDIDCIHSDSLRFLNKMNDIEKFDIIFADPPYNYTNYDDIIEITMSKNILKKGGIVVLEHDNKQIFEQENVETRKYGTVHFSIFQF